LNPDDDKLAFLDPASNDNIDPELTIMTLEEAQHAKEKFMKAIETSYLQALRDQESVRTATQVPMYIIVLLIVLGFNEFIQVITNPILLFFVVVLGGTGYVLWVLNLMGPAKSIIEGLLQASFSGAQGWITDQISGTGTATHPKKD
jgi:hypothetical protein